MGLPLKRREARPKPAPQYFFKKGVRARARRARGIKRALGFARLLSRICVFVESCF